MPNPTPKKHRLPGILLRVGLAVACLIAALSFGWAYDLPLPHALRYPSLLAMDASGHSAVVTDQQRYVYLLDENRRICGKTELRKSDGRDPYIGVAIALDGGSLYVADAIFADNSTAILEERILQYDARGRYLATLYDVKYDAAQQRKTVALADLAVWGGQLYVTTVDGDRSTLHTLADGQLHEVFHLSTGGQTIFRAAYEPVGGALCLTTMAGNVYTGTAADSDSNPNSSPTLRYTPAPGAIINDAALTSGGTLYLCDRAACQLRAVRNDREQILQEDVDTEAFTLSPDASTLLYANRNTDPSYLALGLPSAADTSAAVLQTVSYAPRYAALLWLVWGSRAAFFAYLVGFSIVYLIKWRKLNPGDPEKDADKPRPSGLGLGVVLIFCAVAIALFAVQYVRNQNEEARREMTQLATFLSDTSATTYGDAFATLDKPADYDTAAFRKVSDYFDALWTASTENDINLYYQLYRTAGENVVTIMDNNDLRQAGTPFSPLAGSDYEQLLNGAGVVVSADTDMWGSYLYAAAPIYDTAGQMVGICEIGMDMRQYWAYLAQMLINICLTVLSMVVLGLILFTEFGTLRGVLQGLRLTRGPEQGKTGSPLAASLALTQPVCLFLSLAYEADNSFLSLISKELGGHFPAISMSLAIALPASMLSLGYMTGVFLKDLWVTRVGIRRTMTCMILVTLTSYPVCAVSLYFGIYPLFVPAKLLTGIGQGVLIATLQTMCSYEQDTDRQFHLFGELTIALVTGSILATSVSGFLAQYLGYPAIYLLSLLCSLQALYLVRRHLHPDDEVEALAKKTPAQRNPVLAVLRSAKIVLLPKTFLIAFGLLPLIILFRAFSPFLFPLYSSEMGYPLLYISSILVLVKALSNLLSRVIDVVVGAIGRKLTAVLIYSLEAVSLILFNFNHSYLWAIFVILLVEVSRRIIEPFNTTELITRSAPYGLSATDAIRLMEMLRSVYFILRPILLGALVTTGGYGFTCLVLGVGGLALMGVFLLSERH